LHNSAFNTKQIIEKLFLLLVVLFYFYLSNFLSVSFTSA